MSGPVENSLEFPECDRLDDTVNYSFSRSTRDPGKITVDGKNCRVNCGGIAVGRGRTRGMLSTNNSGMKFAIILTAHTCTWNIYGPQICQLVYILDQDDVWGIFVSFVCYRTGETRGFLSADLFSACVVSENCRFIKTDVTQLCIVILVCEKSPTPTRISSKSILQQKKFLASYTHR